MSNRWLTKPRMFLKGKTSAYITELSRLHVASMLAGIKSNEQSTSRKGAVWKKKKKKPWPNFRHIFKYAAHHCARARQYELCMCWVHPSFLTHQYSSSFKPSLDPQRHVLGRCHQTRVHLAWPGSLSCAELVAWSRFLGRNRKQMFHFKTSLRCLMNPKVKARWSRAVWFASGNGASHS